MKKITVMIVDDEKLAVDDIVHMVDWEQNGFVVLDTAVNGKQAFAKYQQLQPEIIFTDIKMPFMDGIELIKKIRETDSQTKIILLTSYKDFAYAQTAIKYGITDYILKSDISKHTIEQILDNLKRIITMEHSTQNTINEKKLSDYFDGDMQAGVLSVPPLFSASFCYMLVERDVPIPISGDEINDVCAINLTEISEHMEELAGKRNIKVIAQCTLRYRQILQILELNCPSEGELAHKLTEYASTLQAFLSEKYGGTYTVYYLSKRVNIGKFKGLYNAQKSGIRTKYFTGTGHIYDLSALKYEPQTRDMPIDSSLIDEKLKKIDSTGLMQYLDSIFSELKLHQNYDLLLHISRSLYDLLAKKNKQLPDYKKQMDLSFATNFMFWYDAEGVVQWLKSAFVTLIEKTAENQSLSYSKPVVRALNVIWEHYPNRNLNINFIADRVHLSVGHLSLVFKKETGHTVNDYITGIRIEQAKKLLIHSDSKIYEIAEAVGYKSSQYFSQVFYKVTRNTPAEFQKRNCSAQ